MSKFRDDTELAFYKEAAIAAMQGIQENGTKLSPLADMFAIETSKLAFNLADAMLDELHRRLDAAKDDK